MDWLDDLVATVSVCFAIDLATGLRLGLLCARKSAWAVYELLVAARRRGVTAVGQLGLMLIWVVSVWVFLEVIVLIIGFL